MKDKPSSVFPPSATEYWQGIDRLSLDSKQWNASILAGITDSEDRITGLLSNGLEKIDLKLDDRCVKSYQYYSELKSLLLDKSLWVNKQQDDKLAALLEKCDLIIHGVSKINNLLKTIDVRFEREYYKEFAIGKEQKDEAFRDRFLRLVSRLDNTSLETVVLSLQRLKLIKESTEPIMQLYSKEESQRMWYLMEHFYSNVLELNSDCFYYRGYQLPINHFEPCVSIDKLMLSELNNLGCLRNRDIIDAGAYIGDSSLILSPLTQKKVYAFEPTPSSYEQLLKTIELNGVHNIQPHQCALGDKNGIVSISVNDSCSTQFENAAIHYDEKANAQCVTIDDFVKEHNLNVGLIKADIEGAEQLMLQGAMKTIREQKPALLISIYHNASDFFDIKPMLENLKLGYRFKIRHSVGGTVMTETVLIAEVEEEEK